CQATMFARVLTICVATLEPSVVKEGSKELWAMFVRARVSRSKRYRFVLEKNQRRDSRMAIGRAGMTLTSKVEFAQIVSPTWRSRMRTCSRVEVPEGIKSERPAL